MKVTIKKMIRLVKIMLPVGEHAMDKSKLSSLRAHAQRSSSTFMIVVRLESTHSTDLIYDRHLYIVDLVSSLRLFASAILFLFPRTWAATIRILFRFSF